jgi:hypothetical protein
LLLVVVVVEAALGQVVVVPVVLSTRQLLRLPLVNHAL